MFFCCVALVTIAQRIDVSKISNTCQMNQGRYKYMFWKSENLVYACTCTKGGDVVRFEVECLVEQKARFSSFVGVVALLVMHGRRRQQQGRHAAEGIGATAVHPGAMLIVLRRRASIPFVLKHLDKNNKLLHSVA